MSVEPTATPHRRIVDVVAGLLVGVAATLGVVRLAARPAPQPEPFAAPSPPTPLPPRSAPCPPTATVAAAKADTANVDFAAGEDMRRRERNRLMAKLDAGQAHDADVRMLKALCQSEGDKPCVARANEELAKRRGAP